MTIAEVFLQTFAESHTRFSNLLEVIKEEDLKKKLTNTNNSVGFLIRHIAEVELLFAKNVFGATEINVEAKTLMAQHDTGEWTNLAELLSFQQYALQSLKAIILNQNDEDWQVNVTSKLFGTKTKAEALGRIISHTAYHAGQLALILKYGK